MAQRRGTGLTLALISAASFGMSGPFASSLLSAGWTPAAAVTARVTLAAAVLTPFAVAQLRGRWSLLRSGAGMMTGYGLVAIAGCQLCYFNAVSHLSVGVALLVEYMGTVLVVGWLWLRHGQRPRRLTVFGAVAAVAGLVLVLDLAGSHRLSRVGVLWGLGAAIGLALYFVLSSQQASPLPPLVLAWGGMCIGGVTLATLGAIGGLAMKAPQVDVTLFDRQVSWVVPVLCLSLVAAVVGYVAGITAARLLGAKVSSFVGLTEVLFAVAFSWVLLSQVPTSMQFVGGAFIIAGVALVRLDELRAGKPARRDESAQPVGLLG